MPHLLIVAGTSIFTSASWKNEGPFKKIPGYGKWLETPYRDEPSRRAGMHDDPEVPRAGCMTGEAIREEIQELLRDSSSEAKECFATEKTHPMRYSAEVATLLTLSTIQYCETKKDPSETYESISVLCSVDENDLSYIAAHMIAEHLRRLFPGTNSRIIVDAKITRGRIQDRVKSFSEYLNTFAEGMSVHIVVSGGFKVYATVAGHFLDREGWEVIYMHEKQDEEGVAELVRAAKADMKIGQETIWFSTPPPRMIGE